MAARAICRSCQQCCVAHLVLVNCVTLLLVLQRGAEFGLALVNPCDQMVAENRVKIKSRRSF